MRELNVDIITQNIKEMCIEANHFLTDDMKKVFKNAVATEESPLGKKVLNQLNENLDIAGNDMIPICQDTGMAVDVYKRQGSLEVNVNSAIGTLNEDIDIEKEGKDLMIGFNPKFLLDALRVIDDETVDIYLVNPKAPCFIRDKEQSYIYLILPVNFTA